MIQKTIPSKPVDFAKGELRGVRSGELAQAEVLAHTWQADLTLTPRIDPPNSPFWLDAVRCIVTQLTLEQSDEGPLGHSHLVYWDETTLATFNGVAPLSVAPGQRLHVAVNAQAPAQGSAPGRLQATLVIDGASPPLQLALTAEVIGVDPSTPIGMHWATLGGEAALGKPLNNEYDVVGGSRQQDFDRGTLVQPPVGPVVFLALAIQQSFQSVNSDDWNAFFADLGLPTRDTITRPDGTLLQTYSAALLVLRPANPVPLVVLGPICAHYLSLQADLAVPTVEALIGYPRSNPSPGGESQDFDSGYITWRSDLGAHAAHGAIAIAWMRAPGSLGLLVTDELGTHDGVGRFNRCEHGVIYWTPSLGAHEIHGPILDRWSADGLERGPLGYPTSDVHAWTDPHEGRAGFASSFERGQIGWTAKLGAVVYPPEQRTFNAAIVTPDGTALGGNIALTVRSDGTYTLTGHMHDSGFDPYQYRLRALLTVDANTVVAIQHSGKVGGTIGGGSRDDDWTEQGYHAWILKNWAALGSASFSVAKTYSDTGLLGTAESMFHDLTSFLILDVAIGPELALVVALGDELTSLTGQSLPGVGGLPGLLVASGVVWCCGPGAILAATVAGVAVGAVVDALVQHRPPTQQEMAFAATVFKDTLPPAGRLVLTNLSHDGGCAFTLPLIDGSIAVNLGEAFSSPTTWPPRTATPSGGHYPAAGQLFIHELTHAWQIFNDAYIVDLVCRRETHPGEYSYGPAGQPWSKFGLEQQASIVDQWFGGNWGDDNPGRPAADPNDAYFMYIENNIWLGDVG